MFVFFTTAVSKPFLEERIETFDNVSPCSLTRFWGAFFLVSVSAKKWKKCYQWDSTKTFRLSCGWNVNKKSALFFIGSNMYQIMAFQIELLLILLFCLVIVSPEVHQFKLWELPLWASTYKLVNVFFAYSTNMPMLFLQLFLCFELIYVLVGGMCFS